MNHHDPQCNNNRRPNLLSLISPNNLADSGNTSTFELVHLQVSMIWKQLNNNSDNSQYASILNCKTDQNLSHHRYTRTHDSDNSYRYFVPSDESVFSPMSQRL